MSSLTQPTDSSAQGLLNAAARAVNGLKAKHPPFALRVAFAVDYDDLLESRYTAVGSENDMLEAARLDGRLIITAPAGSGKSQMLTRMARTALEQKIVPLSIALKDQQTWIFEHHNDVDSMIRELLLRGMESIGSDLPLAALATVDAILLADGLNEIPTSLIRPTLRAFDEIAFRFPRMAVIATDRLVRRPIRTARWKVGTLLPLDPSQVRDIWARAGHGELLDDLGLLTRPFFLDQALVSDRIWRTSAEALRAYFEAAGLTHPELERAAQAAYRAYERFRSRVIPSDWIQQQVGEHIFTELAASGLLISSSSQTYFRHHLFHDYLAAFWISRDSTLWEPNGFHTATLSASSFDVFRLCAEQLKDQRSADAFARSVYDWNYQAVAYALRGPVSENMRISLLAMLADKKWDLILATAQAVTDALLLEGSPVAREMLAATNRAELFAIVERKSPTEEWFAEWQRLFLMDSTSTVGPETVVQLTSPDSLKGWTLANVLRRVQLTPDADELLGSFVDHKSAVVRWRAIHVLGARPSTGMAERLLDALGDDNKWVRYGAIRSLVEMAARGSSPLRRSIADALVDRVVAREQEPLVLTELARALMVRPAPQDWADAVGPIVQRLWGRSNTADEQELWALVARDLMAEKERNESGS